MAQIINFFLIAPSHTLVGTFYKSAHKFREGGYSILIHDTSPLIQLIKDFKDDVQFRVLVHMDFKGKNNIKEIPDCQGWKEMKHLKKGFPNGNFIFFTRENEIFPSKGAVEGEKLIYENFEIVFGDEMTNENFFNTIPINTKGEIGNGIAHSEISTKSIEKEITEVISVPNTQKEKCDVVIVCVTSAEFEAMDMIFNLNENEPYKIISGNRFWKSSVKQNINSKKELNIVLTMIGDEGNIPASLLINLIFQNFDFELISIVGIAAGNSSKTKIYSTVLGNYIVYYENEKLVGEGNNEKRNKPIPIDDNRGKDLPQITGSFHASKWKLAFSEKLKNQKIEITEFDKVIGDWINPSWFESVKVTSGTILSGEKLFADGTTLLELFKNNEIGKDALAGEMEGYGFAHTCRAKRHNDWLVIRGISDYGGAEKSDPINKQYQKVAALSAMTLLEYYLQNLYSAVNK